MVSTRSETRAENAKFMLLSADRVLYAGLLGRPKDRTFCAPSIYVSLSGALRLTSRGGETETADCFLVPAFATHRIESDEANVLNLIIEPESVDPTVLERLGFDAARPTPGSFAATFRRGYRERREGANPAGVNTAAIDHSFLGTVLAPRRLDPRIARVIAAMRRNEDYNMAAGECASSVNLSMSRFLHLFKEETDTPFRTFRAWKRARRLLFYANEQINLAHLALDIGYPDSTHFSHSIRKFYGLKPSAIFSGSRDLAIYQA